MSAQRGRLPRAFLLGGLMALALSCASAAPASAQAPHWSVIARPAPTTLVVGKEAWLTVTAIDLGDAPVVATAEHPVVFTATLPPGVEVIGEPAGGGVPGVTETTSTCEPLPALRCTFTGRVPPSLTLRYKIPVRATTSGNLGEADVRIEGGQTAPALAHADLQVGTNETVPFGVERYELDAENEDGTFDVQAGSHPFQLTTTLEFNQTLAKNVQFKSSETLVPGTPQLVRNVTTTLPVGLVANVSAVPQCTELQFETILSGDSDLCPADTAIGTAVVSFKEPGFVPLGLETVPVFNLTPAPGEPARLGFEFDAVPVTLDTSIKTGEGYAAQVSVTNSSQAAEVMGTVVTIWGAPNDSRHDESRGWACLGGGHFVVGLEPRPPCKALGTSQPPPYLTMPTTCSQSQTSSMQVQSWERGASPLAPVAFTMPTLGGCGLLPFDPSIEVRPDRSEAATPSGLDVEVKVPQTSTLTADENAEADITKTSLRLPPGMLASAGSADGLGLCSTSAVGFKAGGDSDSGSALEQELATQSFTPFGTSCPDASKVGTVNIKTPLLEDELTGDLYFGSQDTNPFGSPLAMYLIAEDPKSGVRVKLAGEVKLNHSTGQIESVFSNSPPLPFETLKLHLYNGPRATQSTPAHCGANETSASFQPSNGGAVAQRSSSFQTTPNGDGQPCPGSGSLPFSPSLQAGSNSNQAGGFSPFTVAIVRPDGDAAIKTISIKLPPGAAAELANVPLCPEPQASEGTCGAESAIGHATALSGLGSNPVSLPGTVYLTGPYSGAPFGLSTVTEAKAGPLDLGKVVVRSSISVDENTAQATIDTAASQFSPLRDEGEQKSFDGLPEMLKGTPAQIKQLNVTVDREGFEFNPTNCSPLSVTGSMTGYEGTSASISSPFQVTNCGALPFAPKLTASVLGHASKANGTTFDVTVQSAGIGQANIHKVDLTIPARLPSRLTTIQKACVAATFEANPASCPEGSVIGEGVVHTPVLKSVLRGPAYLVSHGGAAFPDVEFVLQGEGIRLLLDGKTDIKKGVTYSRFETTPDAPFTRFESIFPAGPHSALTANVPESENFSLCKQTITAPTEITAQSGAFVSQNTPVAILGCGGVRSFKLTKAQLLAKGLKACRTKYKAKSKKAKRASCEAQVRKKYGAKKAKKTSKKKN
jgi:hypothetical protein